MEAEGAGEASLLSRFTELHARIQVMHMWREPVKLELLAIIRDEVLPALGRGTGNNNKQDARMTAQAAKLKQLESDGAQTVRELNESHARETAKLREDLAKAVCVVACSTCGM